MSPATVEPTPQAARQSLDANAAKKIIESSKTAKGGGEKTGASGTAATLVVGTGKFCSIHKGEPLVEPPVVEEKRPSNFCEGEVPPHYGFGRILIVGFLRGLLERLHVLSLLPDANLSPELCIKLVPENAQEKYVQQRKVQLIEAADKMHTLLWRKPPVSKFCVELEWLQHVLQATLTEVEDSGSFEVMLRTYEEDEKKEAKLPASLEHELWLKRDMVNIAMLLEVEAAAQRALDKEWKKILQHLRCSRT